MKALINTIGKNLPNYSEVINTTLKLKWRQSVFCQVSLIIIIIMYNLKLFDHLPRLTILNTNPIQAVVFVYFICIYTYIYYLVIVY